MRLLLQIVLAVAVLASASTAQAQMRLQGIDWNGDGDVDNIDYQIAQRYRGYDLNADDRVGRSEWPGDARLFLRLDTNRDGHLTIQEYTQGNGFNLDALGGPAFGFSAIDANNGGWLTRRGGHGANFRLDIS
jgi:opacity protein-like surface antigen